MTLLALDVAANTNFKNPTVYTYASPRTGDPSFASTYNQVVKNSFRIANRLDLVPKLPLPPKYDHVRGPHELNPIQLFPLPPKILVKPTILASTASTAIFISCPWSLVALSCRWIQHASLDGDEGTWKRRKIE